MQQTGWLLIIIPEQLWRIILLFSYTLQELAQSINRLSTQLLPWRQIQVEGEVTTSKLIDIVDSMMEDDQSPSNQVRQLHRNKLLMGTVSNCICVVVFTYEGHLIAMSRWKNSLVKLRKLHVRCTSGCKSSPKLKDNIWYFVFLFKWRTVYICCCVQWLSFLK